MKRKILFVAHHLTVGGAQKSLISALRALDYDKNDVTLYIRKNRLDLVDLVDNRVCVIVNKDETHYYRNVVAACFLLLIKLCEIFGLKRYVSKLKDCLSDRIREQMMDYEMGQYFRGKSYDVAISYIQGYSADLVAERIDAKKKYLFYHSSTDEAHEFHEYTFPKYDAVIAVGDKIKKSLMSWYPNCIREIEVLYNYVDYIEVRKQAEQKKVTVPENKIVLCSCGRLNRVKGFDLAIEVAKLLRDREEQFVWYFVGDGPERDKLEKKIGEYALENNVIITGMQSNPYPWINACDIYVQPSYEEAHPLSVIEAQILCKPVVTTATVGGKHIIHSGVNGLVCNINEVALAESIQILIESPEKQKEITKNLRAVDYAQAFVEYKEKWAEVLEG